MEYQKYKDLSQRIDEVPRMNRDTFIAAGILNNIEKKSVLPKLDIQQLENAFIDVLRRAEINATHNINVEVLSVRDRMTQIIELVRCNENIKFTDCFNITEGKMGVVVTFLAILELVKESIIDILQNDTFSNKENFFWLVLGCINEFCNFANIAQHGTTSCI